MHRAPTTGGLRVPQGATCSQPRRNCRSADIKGEVVGACASHSLSAMAKWSFFCGSLDGVVLSTHSMAGTCVCCLQDTICRDLLCYLLGPTQHSCPQWRPSSDQSDACLVRHSIYQRQAGWRLPPVLQILFAEEALQETVLVGDAQLEESPSLQAHWTFCRAGNRTAHQS